MNERGSTRQLKNRVYQRPKTFPWIQDNYEQAVPSQNSSYLHNFTIGASSSDRDGRQTAGRWLFPAEAQVVNCNTGLLQNWLPWTIFHKLSFHLNCIVHSLKACMIPEKVQIPMLPSVRPAVTTLFAAISLI